MVAVHNLQLFVTLLAVVSAAPTQTALGPGAGQDRPIPCTVFRSGICKKLDCAFNQAYFDPNTLHCTCPDRPSNKIKTDKEQPCLEIGVNIYSTMKCAFGQAYFDDKTLSCVCRDSPDIQIPHPCAETVCGGDKEAMYSTLDDACICSTVRDLFDSSIPIALGTNPEDPGSPLTQFQQRDPGQDESVVQISDPEPSYIPPPKPDITPDLIAEALAIQPQNTATVSSIIPYFKSGIFKVFIQLNGPVAVTIVVNASVSLPCDSIGLADPQPNVALVPKVVHEGQGVNQTVIADCEVIAVNMYNPQVITYWIQKIADGTLYSVVSSNKVRDIDKMDTSQSVALALVTLSGGEKRSLPHTAGLIAPEKRQIFAADCVVACPFYHMHMIQGTDGYCGCMFNSAEQEVKLTTRGIKEPDVYTTIMTAEACAAMICFNEGNKPAAFNPFTRTCWCYTQPTIDSNPSAWNG